MRDVTQGAGFQEAFVIAAKFHFTNPDAVPLKKELLDLRVGETVEPVVKLGELFVAEAGKFGVEAIVFS